MIVFFLSQNEYLYGEGYYNVRSHVPLVNNLVNNLVNSS